MIVHPESFTRHRADAQKLFDTSMWHMSPQMRIRDLISYNNGILQIGGDQYSLDDDPVWVIGAGKAAHTMASSLEDVLGDVISGGFIISQRGVAFHSSRIKCMGGDHPLPSDASLAASLELDRTIGQIPPNALVIALISGGTSSLVTIPPIGIRIDDVAQTVDVLLKSGAGISEINAVRRHLCQLKGGRLAQKLQARRLVSLIYSDVPGDRLHDIGSGLTVPDPSHFVDALEVLDRYRLRSTTPDPVLRYLLEGVDGLHPETPKPQTDMGISHQVVMLGSSGLLADQVVVQAVTMGYQSEAIHPAYDTTARQQAEVIAAKVKECAGYASKSQVIVYHGESRVHVTGNGKGGRNQELALLVLLALEEISVPWTLMSVGTDGIDGNTDAAGAFVYNGLLSVASQLGYTPESYLHNNDSYHFFESIDTLIRTGPTGNNMTDLQILIIEP